MARKHFLQTTALFLIAYAVAPWASTLVIERFSDEQEYTQAIDQTQAPQLIVASKHDLK